MAGNEQKSPPPAADADEEDGPPPIDDKDIELRLAIEALEYEGGAQKRKFHSSKKI